jgi:hypothetical protein
VEKVTKSQGHHVTNGKVTKSPRHQSLEPFLKILFFSSLRANEVSEAILSYNKNPLLSKKTHNA